MGQGTYSNSARRFMRNIPSQLLIILSLVMMTTQAEALTTPINLMLVSPSSGVNEMTLTLATDVAGSDSDNVTLAGNIEADLQFQFVAGNVIPTGLSFTGGDLTVSDANFSFLFGLAQINSTGIGGTPFTTSPPSPLSGNTFAAADHGVLVDRGMVDAAGTTFDFAADPTVFQGTGTGLFNATTMPGPTPNYVVDLTLELPLEINQDFFVPGVPVVGDVNATLSGSSNAVATDQLMLTLIAGDYNLDGQLDCQDAQILADEVATGSTDLTFDANLDGTVDGLDIPAWAIDLVGTIPGDANLDLEVNGGDFLIWNANKFDGGTHWCTGDFNGDGITNGGDFLLWNANKFSSADMAAVPEPASTGLLLAFLGALFFRQKQT